jgi:predicted  nucleic acid-binding Zn-ribbon protein
MTIEETREETWKRTIADMQSEIHALQLTIVRLQEQIKKLETENQPTYSRNELEQMDTTLSGPEFRQRYRT